MIQGVVIGQLVILLVVIIANKTKGKYINGWGVVGLELILLPQIIGIFKAWNDSRLFVLFSILTFMGIFLLRSGFIVKGKTSSNNQ